MWTKKSKIILDCDLMKYPNSGLYHYCLNLGVSVQSLLQQDDFAEMAFYVPPQEVKTFGPGTNCIEEKKSLWHFFNPVLKGCDIWHAPFQSGRMVPDKRRHPGVKVLLTIHDLNPLHEGKSVNEQRISLAHTQSLINKADALVCISQFCKEDVLRNCRVDNKPVYVIHNGTHKVHEPQLTAKSYKPQRPFLFGMGYVNRKKNYHVLLPLLENETVEMIIAGRLDEPDYVQHIQNEAHRLGVADRLILTGPVTEGEKAWYFKNCMAFVHPSLAEGFGAPVVEVMQFGKPLFLSALTSLPEIGGDAAFYFSSFEKEHMQQIFFKGMEIYNSNGMAERVKARGAAFDWQQKAKEYLAVYKTLVNLKK